MPNSELPPDATSSPPPGDAGNMLWPTPTTGSNSRQTRGTSAQKLGARKTEVHPFTVAAGLRHGGDSAVALHLVSILVAVTACPEGHDQARRQNGPSATQRG